MKKTISVTPIKTKIFHRGDDIYTFLKESLSGENLEGRVIAITSKIISLAEKMTISKSEISKNKLVKAESDKYIGPGGFGAELTIKHGILIPSAGIDESNAEENGYILYPKNPYESAHKIWKFLREEFKLKNCAVILTDSHTMPLRRGVMGISLAHWGFKATRSLIGHPDIFGRELKFTHVDVVDSLASMAVFIMGEADDCTPLALILGADLEYSEKTSSEEIKIEPENDLYFPLLKNFI